MKKITSQQLTNNSEINKLLVANTQLSDKINDEDTFIDLIEHLHYNSCLTKDDLHKILYETFDIHKNLNQFDEQTVLTIAKLGFEHEQILHSNFVDVKHYFAEHYLHLDTLLEDHDEEIRDAARRQLISYNRMTESSESMQQLFNALNLRDFISVYCVTIELYYVITHSLSIWSRLDNGVSMTIVSNQDNSYDVRIVIDEPITYNFNHDILLTLLTYGITALSSSQDDSVTLRNPEMSLEALIDFVDWFFSDSI